MAPPFVVPPAVVPPADVPAHGTRRQVLLAAAGFALVVLLTGLAFAAGYLTARPAADRYDVSVLLTDDITEQQRGAVRSTLETMRPEHGVRFETRGEAWASFQRTFKDHPELLEKAGPQSMPEAFRLTTVGRSFDCGKAALVRHLPGVDRVTVIRKPTKHQPGAQLGC